MGHFFWVSSGQSSRSACLRVRICLSRGPALCVHMSQPRWIPPQRPVGSCRHLLRGGAPPFLTSKELPSRECLLDFQNEKYVVSYLLSGQGPASSLDCPAFLVLEYRSTGNESPIAYPGGARLPPASSGQTWLHARLKHMFKVSPNVGPQLPADLSPCAFLSAAHHLGLSLS